MWATEESAANFGHFNWFPHVGGKVWEVEYDTLTDPGPPAGKAFYRVANQGGGVLRPLKVRKNCTTFS
jgi:hypothetical protein